MPNAIGVDISAEVENVKTFFDKFLAEGGRKNERQVYKYANRYARKKIKKTPMDQNSIWQISRFGQELSNLIDKVKSKIIKVKGNLKGFEPLVMLNHHMTGMKFKKYVQFYLSMHYKNSMYN